MTQRLACERGRSDAPAGRDVDVLIMGGGPGGATLAALLARRTELRVAVFDQAQFPRPHIGESLISRVTYLLHRSGALPKILASDCWLKKEGAVFDWDPAEDPYPLLFGHEAYVRDGISRWAMHVERASFDTILLDHARECGADVTTGVRVRAVTPGPTCTRVELSDGRALTCRIFVDASGQGSSPLAVPRAYLSSYRNVAIWGHFTGGRPARELPGEWNLFRDQMRPACSFAFEDGWFWYIPTRREPPGGGPRAEVHSLGLVTDPRLLNQPGKRYTELPDFLARARAHPRLGPLVAGAELISPRLGTATNYSMISARLCDYDAGWILLGDAAFFVDPLFASGVTLAVGEAFSAALLIEATLEAGLPELLQRDLWGDYDRRYRETADTLAAMIDRWYRAIGRTYPGSSYARERAARPDAGDPVETLATLFDLSLLDAFLDFSIPAEHKDRWRRFFEGAEDPTPAPAPAPGSLVRLSAGVRVRQAATLGAVSSQVPAEFWLDPAAFSASPTPLQPFYPCHRFEREPCGPAADPRDPDDLPFFDRHEHGLALYAALRRGPQPYAALDRTSPPGQRRLLARLLRAGLVELSG